MKRTIKTITHLLLFAMLLNCVTTALAQNPAKIVGDTVICLGSPLIYKVDIAMPETIYEWEVKKGMGILSNPTGHYVTVMWLSEGTLYLYRTSVAVPHTKVLIDSLSVTQFNHDYVEITPISAEPYYANCTHGYQVTYLGVPLTDAHSYEWSITPEEVASVVENSYDYNPVVLNKHTTSPIMAQINLRYDRCGLRTKGKRFVITPEPNLNDTHAQHLSCRDYPHKQIDTLLNATISNQKRKKRSPISPAVAVQFDCVDNKHRTILENVSKVHPSVASYQYEFIVNDTVYTSEQYAHYLPEGATHTVRLRTIYKGMEYFSEPVTFTVPSLTAEFTVAPNPICEGIPVTFTPHQTDHILDQTWQFGENNPLKTYIGKHNFTIPRYTLKEIPILNFSASLTIEDDYGCIQTVTKAIDVWRNSIEGEVLPHHVLATEGEGLELSAESYPTVDNVPPITYTWRDSLGENQLAYPTVSGSYSVELTNGLGCFAVYLANQTTIIPVPKPIIIGAQEIHVGETLQLSGYYGKGYQYEWSRMEKPNEVLHKGAVYTEIVTEPGTYTYQLTVSYDKARVSGKATVTVTVLPAR